MKFFLHSSTNASTIVSSLGGVDYSYYFVLESFKPLLAQFGEVQVLDEPLDRQHREQLSLTGEDYYFSFTPPNRVELSSGLPVIPVFAWEFGTLPDEAFTCPQDDWSYVLGESGHAITHSSYAVDVVRDSLGEDFPVVSIPAPVWDGYGDIRARRQKGHLALEHLALECTAIDSADFAVSDFPGVRPSIVKGRPHDTRDLVIDDSDAWFGVHPVEAWGRWTEQKTCGVSLPYPVSGSVLVSFVIINSLLEPGHSFQLELGGQVQSVTISGPNQCVDIVFADCDDADQLRFTGLGTCAVADEGDDRVMGIGISGLYVRSPQGVLNAGDAAGSGNLLQKVEVKAVGFHDPEPWGRWSRRSDCSIFLPFYLEGDVTLIFTVSANPHKQRSELTVSMGDADCTVSLSALSRTLKVSFKHLKRTNLVRISGIHAAVLEGSDDPREIGLGFASLELELSKPGGTAISGERDAAPILYTTVFNPIDGRKNWPDILKAFIFALRDEPRALLVVKLTHSELSPFVADLCSYFTGLAPFECRIIFLHGYLQREAFENLIEASHFTVNAARGEGQCLPLMEFMSSGVPAIAPNNTAMGDYVNRDNSFVVDSTIEPAVWPHDPRLLLRTTRYRINWDSLYRGFQESFAVAMGDEHRYRQMSDAAVESLRQYCSYEVTTARMAEFLESVRRSESN